MNLTKYLFMPAINFELWGVKFEVILIMAILILLTAAILWLYNKRQTIIIEKQKLALEEYKINSQNPMYCKVHKQFMVFSHENNNGVYLKCPVESCTRIYEQKKEQERKIIGRVDLENPYK